MYRWVILCFKKKYHYLLIAWLQFDEEDTLANYLKECCDQETKDMSQPLLLATPGIIDNGKEDSELLIPE